MFLRDCNSLSITQNYNFEKKYELASLPLCMTLTILIWVRLDACTYVHAAKLQEQSQVTDEQNHSDWIIRYRFAWKKTVPYAYNHFVLHLLFHIVVNKSVFACLFLLSLIVYSNRLLPLPFTVPLPMNWLALQGFISIIAISVSPANFHKTKCYKTSFGL